MNNKECKHQWYCSRTVIYRGFLMLLIIMNNTESKYHWCFTLWYLLLLIVFITVPVKILRLVSYRYIILLYSLGILCCLIQYKHHSPAKVLYLIVEFILSCLVHSDDIIVHNQIKWNGYHHIQHYSMLPDTSFSMYLIKFRKGFEPCKLS